MSGDQKVNLFIVGAAKSGTTSLYNQLASHPDICMCTIKEPNFFSAAELKKDALYYEEKIVSSLDNYTSLFKPKKNQRIIGEASVSYLYYPGTADKIFRYNDQSKVIIILRNPCYRAFSHYQMDKNLGYINRSFEDIIREEKSGEEYSAYFRQYMSYGMYSKQVEDYIRVFPAKQLMILLFEELQQSATDVQEKIMAFLNLSGTHCPVDHTIYNESGSPDHPLLLYFYRIRLLRKAIRLIIPENAIQYLRKYIFSSHHETLTNEQQRWLKNYFKEDIMKLEGLIKRKLNTWYE